MWATFPPPPPTIVSPAVLHAVMCGLLLLSFAALFRTYRRRAQLEEPVAWLAALGFGTFLLCSGLRTASLPEHLLIFYPLLLWSVAGTGFVLALVRRVKQTEGVPLQWVLGGLTSSGVLLLALLAVSVPKVAAVPEVANRSVCRSNLKQIGLTFHHWHEEHGRFPDADHSAPEHPPLSWRVALLPHFHESNVPIFEQYDQAKPWDDPANLPVAQADRYLFRCPANFNAQDDQGRYFTAYALITGPKTTFPAGRGLSFSDITDGTAHTLLVAEACGLNIVWTEPRDIDVDRQPIGVNLPGDSPEHSPGIASSYHRGGGAHVLSADGSVRFISNDIDPQVLRALTPPAGDDGVEDW